MTTNHNVIILVAAVLLVVGQHRAWGQTDSTDTPPDYSQYMPKVEVPLIGKPTVTFPGQEPIKVSRDDLGDLLADYVEKISNQLSPDDNNSLGDLQSSWSGIKDELSDEVSNLIGEKEDEIMAGISDKIAKIAANLADVGTTPASEVDRLKKMVAKGYTAQQKITYQTLKVDYAWKKWNTTLSPEFCDYYNSLNVKSLFSAVKNQGTQVGTLLSKPVFTAAERQGYHKLLNALTDTRDLTTAVNIVCNKGAGGKQLTLAWMSQGERMDVLDQSAEALKQRLLDIGSFKDQLRQVYVYRYGRLQSSEYMQLNFKKKSALNHVYDK